MDQMSAWSDFPDLDAEMVRLHKTGLSMTQVAKRLGHGLSRNAIIGRLARLNGRAGGGVKRTYHPRANNGAGKPKKKAPDRRAPPKPTAPPLLPRATAAPPVPHPAATHGGFRLEDVPRNSCKFAISPDHERDHRFCGQPIAEPSTWLCETHLPVAHTPSQPRRVRYQSMFDRDVVRK
jgi:GcrA cell cycle regulator